MVVFLSGACYTVDVFIGVYYNIDAGIMKHVMVSLFCYVCVRHRENITCTPGEVDK